MQSEGLKENYIKKLDDIIEFFKTEKETWTFALYIGKEDNKFYHNAAISTFVLFIGVFTIVLNIDSVKQDLRLVRLIVQGFAVCFFILGLYIFFDSRNSKKINSAIINKTVSFNLKISFLQSLKILPYEVDLSKLVDKIKYRSHLNSIHYPKDEKYIEETFFIEINNCFSEINKEILEKQKKDKFIS